MRHNYGKFCAQLFFAVSYLIHDQRNFATITALSLHTALLVIGHNDMGANSAVLAISFFASRLPPWRFSRAKRERAGSAWRTTFLRS